MAIGPTKWTWRDADEIALDLVERHPVTDPLTVTLPELKRLVLELPSFHDDPDAATDKVLENIQAAWYDEYED
jgi:FeS assembly protein IscX